MNEATDLTLAQAACAALGDAMEHDARVVAVGEDLGRGGIFGQYAGLQRRFGVDRIVDTPISEATIMGAALGMALAGLKPVVEMRIADFALCAMDEIVNQVAKNRFMFGGQKRVPVVMRMPIGMWDGSAAQHSQSFESWFAHLPGVAVVCPATPHDAFHLLAAAVRAEEPVMVMEHKMLWAARGAVDRADPVPLGRAAVRRRGTALTIVSWSRQAIVCAQACDALAAQGIDAELIDLRSLWPWDREAVFESVARTRALLVVHEAVQVAGFGAEVAAAAAEATGCRVARLGAPRIPVAYSPPLEAQARIDVAAVERAAVALLR